MRGGGGDIYGAGQVYFAYVFTLDCVVSFFSCNIGMRFSVPLTEMLRDMPHAVGCHIMHYKDVCWVLRKLGKPGVCLVVVCCLFF